MNRKAGSERKVDVDNPAINGRGIRSDGRNLLEEWLEKHHMLNHTAAYLWNKNHLHMLHEGDYNEDYILGKFGGQLQLQYSTQIAAETTSSNAIPEIATFCMLQYFRSKKYVRR